jgi:hypothetical protein
MEQEAMKPGGTPNLGFVASESSAAFLRVSWLPAQTLTSLMKLSVFKVSRQPAHPLAPEKLSFETHGRERILAYIFVS